MRQFLSLFVCSEVRSFPCISVGDVGQDNARIHSSRSVPQPEIDFIRLSSYGLTGTVGSEKISVRLRPGSDLRGRDVVVVEDIVDTGRTLRFLRRYVARRGPASLRVCALLVRTHAGNEKERLVDYRGFTVGVGWLVGYGLDCSERYRALPDIYVVEGEQ